MEKYYKISESGLLDLLESARQLTALSSTGVDNWSGYGERHEYLDDEVTEKDLANMYELVGTYNCTQCGNLVLKGN